MMLAAAVGVHARLLELEPAIHAPTRPRPSNSDAELRALEAESGEVLPPGYREFLLAADGWKHYYFRLSLFGLAELRGGGAWARGQELLRTYNEEEVLEHLGIDAGDVVPVAAGQRLHLILAYRASTAEAGRIAWIDAGEQVKRYEDFRACFADLAGRKYRSLTRINSARPR
jgi:hypothetical protein